MMTYSQAMHYIHDRKAHSAKPGLHRITALLEQLGNPHKGLPLLHIAGTNGKGSTATMLATVLQKAGYKTGCFTSPFIYDFRERYTINGQMISQEKLAELAQQVQTAEEILIAGGMEQATEFDIVTAIGFLFFKECDITVLEVGMGGRFDATNVIEAPLASVICSISMDHTEYLGNTVEQIAFEKSGIIKQGRPVILYNNNPPEAVAVIAEQCKKKNAPLVIGEKAHLLESNENGNRFIYKGNEYTISLNGAHQINNAVTVIETLEHLKTAGLLTYTKEQLQDGLSSAYIPSRLECICKEPYIFVDGGHNREGIDVLLKAMDTIEALKNPVIIFGMMKDKPYQYAVQKLALRAKAFITVQPPLPRAMTAYDLKNMADLFCDDCTACNSYAEAAILAKEKNDGGILVAGSLYMAGDMANELKKLF